MRRYSSLGPREQRATARRLRLEWASSGDVEHAAGVARMVEVAELADRRRHGPRSSTVERNRSELEAAYAA